MGRIIEILVFIVILVILYKFFNTFIILGLVAIAAYYIYLFLKKRRII